MEDCQGYEAEEKTELNVKVSNSLSLHKHKPSETRTISDTNWFLDPIETKSCQPEIKCLNLQVPGQAANALQYKSPLHKYVKLNICACMTVHLQLVKQAALMDFGSLPKIKDF